ncbi:MAG: hypothetical protein ACRDOS_17005 [Gaiellaceae bacterium]
MSKLTKLDDAEVSAQLDELRDQRQALARNHQGIIRDDAHAAFERSREEAREAFATTLRVQQPRDLVRGFALETPTPGYPNLVRLSALWNAGFGEDFAAAVHTSIDGVEGWSKLSRADYDKRLAKFDQDIAEREAELKRRDIDRRRQELEAELNSLEVGA